MRKIRLSDSDFEFFDMEISPSEFMFFQKHKEAFRCMWKEQGKPFWTKFTITFRSFTVKHGVIKQMSCDSPKFENMLDQAFIFLHEQYVDSKDGAARVFIEDIARLAQNHDKFPNLDSKSFSKDPFYSRETRELFRRFFGSPDQKSSYLKVYVLSPIYLRFGGSVCRCLKKWMDAPNQDVKDESYWVPPTPSSDGGRDRKCSKVLMCTNCLDDCGTKYFREKLCGQPDGPKFIEYWRLGDPRFNDSKNPLYNPSNDRDSDWRVELKVEDFRDFLHYAKFRYGTDDDKCKECLSLLDHHKIHICKGSECCLDKKKKKKKKKKEKTEQTENKTDEETQKLADYINGKISLDVMPASTKAGAVSATDDSKEKELEEKKKKKRIFTKQAKITDDFKYGILSGAEDLKKHNVVGGFKVVKIEDERTLASEITITVAALKGEEPDRKPKIKDEKATNSQNMFPLSAPLIRSKIDNLPEKMEWWEGQGWCACVLDYEKEEKALCKFPTNFTIKISGPDEDSMKRTMFKLLFYVSKRKKRPCPGWCMDDDDVVACILPDDSPDQEGLTICIQKGFRFEDRLTDEERKSLQKPFDPCHPKKKKVLMTLDGKEAEMLRGEQGRETLRELLARISGDCNDDKEEQIPLNDGSTIHLSKGSPPIVDIRAAQLAAQNPPAKLETRPDEGPLWEQMQKNPDKFELFVMVDKEKEPELRKHGLKPVDLANFKAEHEARRKKKCSNCESTIAECKCDEDEKVKKQRCLTEGEKSEPEKKKPHLLYHNEECESDCCLFGEEVEEVIQSQLANDYKPPVVLRTTAASEETNEDENISESDKVFKPKIQVDLSDCDSNTSSKPPEEETKDDTENSSDNKKAEVFKFTAKGDNTSPPKSPVKTGSKSSKSVKSTISGTVNFSITTENIHEGLNFKLDAHIPPSEDGSVSSSKSSVTVTPVDDNKDSAEQEKENCISATEKEENKELKDEGTESDQVKLRQCASCNKTEPNFKAFKKCQKCKQEGILNARYYCGRECQIADWTERHKREHKEHLLD